MSSKPPNFTFKLVLLGDGGQDMAGQERFYSLGPIYYRDADGIYATSIGAKLFVTSAKPVRYIIQLEKKKDTTEGLSHAPPRKGILVITDETEQEPPRKCCS